MLVSGAILGFIAGFALRRDWRPLREFQLRAFPVLLAAILMRGVALAVPRVGLPLEVLGIAAIGLVALINRRTTGMVLIAVGCALNVLVIVVNQGMPVASDALLSAGAEMPHDPLHVVLGEATRLPALGDIIPVGPFHSVYSVGDLAIAIGGFVVPFRALLKS